ncbi:flagellar hook-associated protein FlgK [Niveispirillum sp. KHB5.9]|uniref:flagellar hook-associated protein FlgK n=1 Tax=Niveispirillum sp. KHB5.9 TaxID=3400269 RepID=UPI003A8B25D1
MSIGLALQTALSGLQANQTKSAILSRNIANATTPGYTRKEAVLTSVSIGGEGRGVQVSDFRRSADASLARETRVQASASAAQTSRAQILSVYTQTIGQPQEERSFSAALATLERAFYGLEDLPESPTQQRAVVDAAINLASRLGDANKAIANAREQADAGIGDAVTSINGALKRLEDLNRQVAVRTGSGQDISELEDERDRLLDGLSEQIGIQYFTRDANAIVVMTTGGVTLLDENAREIEFTRTPVIGATASYAGGGLSGLTVDGVDIAPGSGYPNPVKGGRLEGFFAVRDQAMPEMQRQIDEVASVLADRFQQADASAGTTGTGLFTENGARHNRAAGNITGMAGRIQVNDLVRLDAGGDPARVRTGLHAAGGDVGDTTQVRAFLGVFSTSVSFSVSAGLMTSGTVRDFANAAIGQQHAVRASAENSAKSLDIQLETVRATREGREGVNIDEELQELIVLERSYAANAQIMQVASRMLDKLLEI